MKQICDIRHIQVETVLDQQIDLTVSYQAAGYTVNEGATGAVSVTLSPAADRACRSPSQ